MLDLKTVSYRAGLLILAILIVFAYASPLAAQEKKELPDKTFKVIKEYPHTPSKSQGMTGTCWCFSTTSFLETEAMRLGKGEYELSEIFTVHHAYIGKAEAYVRLHGNNNFAQGALFHDAIESVRKNGIVRDSDYPGLWPYETGHNHGELARSLKGYLDGVLDVRRGGPSPKWLPGVKAVLDVYFGPLPEKIEVDGKTITPKQFADDVLGLDMDDYIELTSYLHMPFYTKVELLVPDNWSHYDDTCNVPLDEFLEIIKYALNNGYSVLYGGDVSEDTYDSRGKGYAIWEEDKVITPEEREKMWDNWSTSDDHGMHIVGLAEDESGKTFFYVKDSGGPERGPHQGHIFLSENWVRAKADSIMVHKDGIPAEIKEKLGIE